LTIDCKTRSHGAQSWAPGSQTIGSAAGVRSIGHANKPGKVETLRAAGAEAIVTTIDQIVTAIG
jgi:hypothetical protein